jgi:HEAT repeat protein/tRNA A-37 threonylcarbamoyl transferase component Bud32
MSMLDNYKIKKSINTLLSLQNAAGPEMTQAVARLRQIGRPAIPKLIEALGMARNRERIVALLVTFLENETLPMFVAALGTSSPSRVVAGVVDVLSRGDKYDPNRLLGLFTNPTVSKENLVKILQSHEHRLHPDALLRLLTTASKDDYPIIFHLIDQVASEESLPELIHRLWAEDWTVRLHIARTLSRFKTNMVRDTLVKLLADSHTNVRLMALDGLAGMRMPFDMGSLCKLLQDPEAAVQSKASELLLEYLQDESEDVRRTTVEALSAVDNSDVLRDLLQMLKDKDWWVTARVADALGTHGGTKIVATVLELLKDQDTFIRQCAFETLNTIKDEQTFSSLVNALKDKEIREHAVDALAALGDKRAVPVFLGMLDGDTETSIIAIHALVALGEPQAVHPLLVHLQHPEKAIQKEVLRALAVLTNEEYAPDVLQAVMAVRDCAEEDVKKLANRMATTIIKRFGQKVMPRSVVVETTVQPHKSLGDDVAANSSPASPGLDPSSHSRPVVIVSGGGQTSELPVDVATLEPGMVLADRYRVIRRVGQGGFSTVFLVDDTMVHEDVILKLLNPQVALDNNMIKRFVHELRYARKVTHENVIRIHDFLSLGKSYAISMEYFPSHNLADELQGGKPLALKRGLKIIWDVCRGVGAAHQADVVHRDLKPPNILIDDQGTVKIVDFGVAAVTNDISTRLTRVGTLLGTPTYMAPEQVRSRAIDARTDIYSIGVMMYEVFTGRPPYVGEDMSVLFQHVEGNSVPPSHVNPDLAPGLEAIILKAMAVDPDKRFQNVDELRKSLVEFSRQKH